MKTIEIIKSELENRNNTKVSVSTPTTGSMRGYVTISPITKNNELLSFNFDHLRELKLRFPGTEPNENFFSIHSVSIYAK